MSCDTPDADAKGLNPNRPRLVGGCKLTLRAHSCRSTLAGLDWLDGHGQWPGSLTKRAWHAGVFAPPPPPILGSTLKMFLQTLFLQTLLSGEGTPRNPEINIVLV